MTETLTHRSHRHRDYGMTCEEYDALVDRQGGGCGVCRDVVELIIDHDHRHDERAVRGLVCHPCNVGLRPVDVGYREATPGQAAYLAAAWHLEHRPGLPLLTRIPGVENPDAFPMGVSEIASFLGLSRQRIQQLVVKHGFPEPWADLQQGTIWRDTDIEAWAAARTVTRGRPKRATS